MPASAIDLPTSVLARVLYSVRYSDLLRVARVCSAWKYVLGTAPCVQARTFRKVTKVIVHELLADPLFARHARNTGKESVRARTGTKLRSSILCNPSTSQMAPRRQSRPRPDRPAEDGLVVGPNKAKLASLTRALQEQLCTPSVVILVTLVKIDMNGSYDVRVTNTRSVTVGDFFKTMIVESNKTRRLHSYAEVHKRYKVTDIMSPDTKQICYATDALGVTKILIEDYGALGMDVQYNRISNVARKGLGLRVNLGATGRLDVDNTRGHMRVLSGL